MTTPGTPSSPTAAVPPAEAWAASGPVGRLTVLVLVVVALVGVVGLRVALATSASLDRLDLLVVSQVAAVRPGWLVAAMTVVTDAGSPTVMDVVLVAAAAALAWRARAWRPVLLGGGGLAALIVVDVGVKDLVQRARPPLALHAVPAGGYSFPSGHALISLGVALLVGWLVLTSVPRARVGSTVLSVVVVAVALLAVGASRVVLGVHYPTDVLAGWCLAVFVVGVTVSIDLRLASVRVVAAGTRTGGRRRPRTPR